MSVTDLDFDSRRAARAGCEVKVFRTGDEVAESEASALYWDRIPVDQRAEFVWNLSVEIFGIAHPEQSFESGLSRSVARVVRR